MKGLLILAYHRVHPQRRGSLCVSPTELEAQLRLLLRRGARPIGGNELLHALGPAGAQQEETRMPSLRPHGWGVPQRFTEAPAFLVTFDDGYADFAKHAWPVLRRLGVPAVVFLIHDWVGSREPFPWEVKYNPQLDAEDLPMDWTQVLQLQAEGCEFGSHTLKHPDLAGLDPVRCREEVAGSRSRLMNRLDAGVPLFCYPRGQYSAALAREVEAAGYQAALLTPRRAGLPEHRYCVRRVGIYAADRGWRYRLKASSMFDLLREARFRWSSPTPACCF